MLATATERTGGHEILHDLNTVLVLEVDAGHLIEGHHIPKTDQTDAATAHVVEKVSDGSLAARHKHAVW
ncbi:hypothetical protein D9M71_768390 [compost metagenome]